MIIEKELTVDEIWDLLSEEEIEEIIRIAAEWDKYIDLMKELTKE